MNGGKPGKAGKVSAPKSGKTKKSSVPEVVATAARTRPGAHLNVEDGADVVCIDAADCTLGPAHNKNGLTAQLYHDPENPEFARPPRALQQIRGSLVIVFRNATKNGVRAQAATAQQCGAVGCLVASNLAAETVEEMAHIDDPPGSPEITIPVTSVASLPMRFLCNPFVCRS